MYNLDNVTFARQDGEVFRNIYKYGNGQIWWDIDAKNHNVKARYYDGTDGSIATLWDAAALKGDLTIPGAAWTLDQVNDTSSKRLKIGWINSDTAKSIGINDATDYFQVISIPWNSAYPSQILITASGKQRMYYRTCGNGTWQTPHQLALVGDIVMEAYNAFQNGVTGYLYFEKNNNTKICHCTGFLGTVPTGTTYVLQVDSSLFPSAQITRQAIKNDVSTIINGIIDFRTDGGLRIRSLDASTSGNYMIDFSFKTA